jgi:hypothetical protein
MIFLLSFTVVFVYIVLVILNCRFVNVQFILINIYSYIQVLCLILCDCLLLGIIARP